MGNQHSSGRTEDLATERRNVQFDEIINQLADDLREQMRKKERAEGGRRDPDEGWERFKDALDEFRSRWEGFGYDLWFLQESPNNRKKKKNAL